MVVHYASNNNKQKYMLDLKTFDVTELINWLSWGSCTPVLGNVQQLNSCRDMHKKLKTIAMKKYPPPLLPTLTYQNYI